MEATKEAVDTTDLTEQEPMPLPALIILTAMQRRALNSVLDEAAALMNEIQKLQLLLAQTNKEGDEIVAEIEIINGLKADSLQTAYQYNRREFLLP